MAVRPILTWPNPRLSEVAQAIGTVTQAERDLAEDLLDTMYDAKGRGLAAPQVGVLRQIFVMDVTWKEGVFTPLVFIDPRITWRSEIEVASQEGCLSIPGITTDVTRIAEIRADWTDLEGVAQTAAFSGPEAICVQHELDHLEGVVTLDRLSAAARAEAEAAYRDGLP